MKYARVISNRVNDVCEGDPYKYYVKNLADLFIEVPDEVRVGWYKWGDGTFHSTQEPYWSDTMNAITFIRRFTSPERIAIREASKSDPYVEDVWDLIQLADTINIKDPDLVSGIQYFATQDIIEDSRVEEILAPEYIDPAQQ